jgi:hypothetical protein
MKGFNVRPQQILWSALESASDTAVHARVEWTIDQGDGKMPSEYIHSFSILKL